jgi:hypothetical protein
MSQTRIRLTRAELYEKVRATPMRTLAQELACPTLAWQKSVANTIFPFRQSDIGGERKPTTKSRSLLPAAEDGREHLDIYLRERLSPEFEELARHVPPKIGIAPTSRIHSFRGPRDFAIEANSISEV